MEAEKIPKHYHFLAGSIVKAGLSSFNPELKESLYSFEEHQANKAMRPFTGAIYLNGYTLEGDEFIIHQDIRMTISSSDINFMITLYNGLLEHQQMQYKSYTVHIKHVKFLSEKLQNLKLYLKQTAPSLLKIKTINI